MKRLAFTAIAAVMLAAPVSSSAVSAAPQATYTGYRCIARSPSAAGIWIHTDINVARQGALNHCSVRTPSYQTCYVTTCQWGTWYV